MYIAKKRLKIGDGYREPGEAVPEATTWKRHIVSRHLDLGWLEAVAEPAPAPASVTPEPEPAPEVFTTVSTPSDPAPVDDPLAGIPAEMRNDDTPDYGALQAAADMGEQIAVERYETPDIPF